MGYKVKWLGFHDDAWHESDILNSKEEIKKFIEILEDMSASIIDSETRKKILFKDIQ